MTMKKTFFLLGLMAAAFSLSFVSCGDDDEKIVADDGLVIEVNPSRFNEMEIRVPNEGGHYVVTVKSGKKVGVESLRLEDAMHDLYEYEGGQSLCNMQCEYSLVGQRLEITVGPLNSVEERSVRLALVDAAGDGSIYGSDEWAAINLVQEGRATVPDIGRPLLGTLGTYAVGRIAESMAQGYTYLSLVEQDNLANRALTAGSRFVNDAWAGLNEANAQLLMYQHHDARMLNVYGDYFELLSALNHATLATLWGDVPYNKVYHEVETGNTDLMQKPQAEILADLKARLTDLMGRLEEKVNRPFGDANDFLFASRDVARMVLVGIHLNEGNHSEAVRLLEEVVANGFYQLDSSTEYAEESREIIFALKADRVQGYGFDYDVPTLIPCFTLSDVWLSLAECRYHMGDEAGALHSLKQVTDAKGLELPQADFLTRLQQVRERLLLHSGSYFAFLKRNGLAIKRCGIEGHRLLFPLPSSYMNSMGGDAVQNPGY